MALLNWRIGPGGLFVFSEIHVQQARLRATQLSEQKLRDEIAQQVVTARARARVLSLAHQLATARLPLSDAQENLRLDQERKEFRHRARDDCGGAGVDRRPHRITCALSPTTTKCSTTCFARSAESARISAHRG